MYSSNKKNEEKYYLTPKNCKQCFSIISYEKRVNNFCSSSCSATFNNLAKIKHKSNCLCCEVEIEDRPSRKRKYCSITCQQKFKNDKSLLEGTAGVRLLKNHLIRSFGNRCWECGITEWNNKPITMDLEHIDGNSENNKLDNLSLLCPNCHSQTSTFKGANRGNGRHVRRQRYKEGKSY